VLQLASSVAVGKLWQLTICTPLASCVAVNELHTVGKLYTAGELCGIGRAVWQWTSCVAVDNLCGSGQAVWQWTSCVAVDKLCGSGQSVWQWTSCVAVDMLCGSGQAVWGCFGRIQPGVGVDVRLAYRTYLPPQKGETLGLTKLDTSHD
jgi:hypothetical protein